MFKSHSPAILKVQNVFTPVVAPDKPTSEVKFCVKTIRKKLMFSGFICSVKILNQKKCGGGERIIQHEPVHVE